MSYQDRGEISEQGSDLNVSEGSTSPLASRTAVELFVRECIVSDAVAVIVIAGTGVTYCCSWS